ncbi:hypothetical protein JL2886_02885 [Phaeobacter gallaeciensis]|uniref:Uncharacterized protein n=1 Tax=Phaeobacter gallaeciensis TaxID=60890 RepID=A0A1B0ZUD3_9RHOB|nr:hypothetical protein JL2886_02885 [Phaeobacter gallaeciensis]
MRRGRIPVRRCVPRMGWKNQTRRRRCGSLRVKWTLAVPSAGRARAVADQNDSAGQLSSDM